MVISIDSIYETRLRRHELLFPQSDRQALDLKHNMTCIQGFIDGHAGREFTIAEIVGETGISDSVVHKLLPNCKRYQRLHKGRYRSRAKVPPPTRAGLLEEQDMRTIGLLGEQAREDHFALTTRGKRKK